MNKQGNPNMNSIPIQKSLRSAMTQLTRAISQMYWTLRWQAMEQESAAIGERGMTFEAVSLNYALRNKVIEMKNLLGQLRSQTGPIERSVTKMALQVCVFEYANIKTELFENERRKS